MKTKSNISTVALFLTLSLSLVNAKEIHVSKAGNDGNPGTEAKPFLSISKAADMAVPGDLVTVHGGTYREWIKPPRGGSSEDERITYRAAPGEEVFVKGSERITSWTQVEGEVWKVEIPNTFFGGYNPYELRVSEKYMTYGEWHHRGDVYVNGEAYYEQQSVYDVTLWKKRWHCQVNTGTTTIWANFQSADPNEELVEINVRESIFMPELSGLQYITINGFHFAHSASNWAPPSVEFQSGAIGPRMGKCWIIENCEITNARAVGITLGLAPGADYSDIDSFGDHIIRNNIIRRCGQGGIAGKRGASRCLITGNLIEDTNYRKEFGGHETAGIKFHRSVDAILSNNLIRGVYRQEDAAAFGMWIDFTNQGMRITRNIIYNTETEAVFLEMNHGPILIDNNIIVGKRGISSNSEAGVIVHNLLVDCHFSYSADTHRQSQYFLPHTAIEIEKKPVLLQEERWYNNIFIRVGPDQVAEAPDYKSDFNVFLEGAQKSAFGDEHSTLDPFVTNFRMEDQPRGVKIFFSVNGDPFKVKAPEINAAFIGVFSTTGQSIEDREGKPIKVDTDYNLKEFKKVIPGPLANLNKGENSLTWTFETF